MTKVRTKLVFVDDHPTLLTGLVGIFEADARYQIVGTGTSAQAAVELASKEKPDVMVLDLSMPGDVFAAIASIKSVQPILKFVVFSAYSNVDLALRALDAGAHAFVLKGSPAEELFDAIDSVQCGGFFFSKEISTRITGIRGGVDQT